MDNAARDNSSALNRAMVQVAVFCAYLGGVIVSAIGIMSVISIVGRTIAGKPIQGDFELVEIGTASRAPCSFPIVRPAVVTSSLISSRCAPVPPPGAGWIVSAVS